jgi:MoaA/NifB/PqqE/SkfB family radical SAM enzyme
VETAKTLDWAVVDKLITELHDEMGMRFFVISGGEPLMYKSDGKTILDLPKKWKDSYFLMYTNGTLITDSVAKEMAELGNITPALSVEGFEKETDERRGKGIHKRILKAMENLRNNGVLFGVSVTATKNNADILLTDEFYQFYFEELGATYMWMFQYMPIGRKFTTELMVTPEQRFELFKKWKQILSEKEWFVADFWNSAILSNGCISCGKPGGYFYIDWKGNIMPCVFVPYYKHNVKQLLFEGKKIADALFSDFFVKGREWQSNYFNQNGRLGNMLRPCFIRDHHKTFLDIAKETNVIPQDEAAKEAMEDKEYHNELIKFDERLKEIEDPYWEKEYSKKQKGGE